MIHKKDPKCYATYCGIPLKKAKRSGLWKDVDCPECRKFISYNAEYYNIRTNKKIPPVISVDKVDIKKLRSFFTNKRRNLLNSLEEFLFT